MNICEYFTRCFPTHTILISMLSEYRNAAILTVKSNCSNLNARTFNVSVRNNNYSEVNYNGFGFRFLFLRMLTSTQICLWDTMKIRWTANWQNIFRLKSIPIRLTVHTQKHTSCCRPISVMPCCRVQIMQLIQRQCWTKRLEYVRYSNAFQYLTLTIYC